MNAGGARSEQRRAAGFSLVELLIVITLLVTLSAVLAPILMPSPARTLRGVASEVVVTLREARRLALAGQASRRFLVDTQARRFGIEDASAWRRLPEGVDVALTTAESLLADQRRGGIDFFPNGSSTGGRVTLGMAGQSMHVDIEWLTGRIRVRDAGP